MKNIIFTITFIFSSFALAAQPYFEWGRNLGGTDYDIGSSIASDSKGNVYTVGCFSGTADFDPGPNNYDLTSAGSLDVFISKVDVAGNFLWAQQFSGANDEQGLSVALDSKSNPYVTGYFTGTTDFNPASGSFNLTSKGGIDVFICKLDAAGNFVWAKQMGGVSDDVGYAIKIDLKDNILTTGQFSGTADFNPGTGTNNLVTPAFTGAFISKLNASGNYVWAKNFGGNGDNWGNAITVDNQGNVFTTGYFDGTADFDPGTGTYSVTTYGNTDVFIHKLDSSGNFGWARQIGGTSTDKGWGIALDNNGNVYTTGVYSNVADMNPGSGTSYITSAGDFDIFISKLNPSGTFVWGRGMGGTIDDLATSVFADPTGVYTTGNFNNKADFDPGSNTYYFTTSSGGRDAFISKLDTSGNFIWAKQISSTGSDNLGNSIAVDNKKNIYTAGYFTDSVSLDPNTPSDKLPSAGSTDIFLQKLSQCISTSSNSSITVCNSYTSPSGRYTWTNSGTYKDTIKNTDGCDSMITIQLKINKNSTRTMLVTACKKYISPSSKYQWTTSGTYKDTILNNAGCDSIITVQLTISGTSTSITLTVNACNKYKSPSGKYLWTASNTYNDTIPNKAGCDSLLTINLTINTLDISVTQQGAKLTANTAGGSYQWLDCNNGKQPISGEINQSYSSITGGNYAVIITKGACTDTSVCYLIGSSAISNHSTLSFSVYPNPTKGILKLYAANDLSGAVFKLIDMQGRIIKETRSLQGIETSIDISNQAAGIYFIELTMHNHTSRLKLMKY